jgi:hypothetical protein
VHLRNGRRKALHEPVDLGVGQASLNVAVACTTSPIDDVLPMRMHEPFCPLRCAAWSALPAASSPAGDDGSRALVSYAGTQPRARSATKAGLKRGSLYILNCR